MFDRVQIVSSKIELPTADDLGFIISSELLQNVIRATSLANYLSYSPSKSSLTSVVSHGTQRMH